MREDVTGGPFGDKVFFFNDTATTEIYTLSLHDALPILRALHIMVETEEEIRLIQKELQSKQKDFSELAKEFSLGPEGTLGGDLGYFEAGQMPEEFDNVFKLKIDGVSDIIRTPYGFHLFKVIDKIKERKMSFDESKKPVEQFLLQKLQDSAFQKWLVQLKEKSEIEINYDFFEKIN